MTPARKHPIWSSHDVERHLPQVAGYGLNAGASICNIKKRQASSCGVSTSCSIRPERQARVRIARFLLPPHNASDSGGFGVSHLGRMRPLLLDDIESEVNHRPLHALNCELAGVPLADSAAPTQMDNPTGCER